MTNILQILDDLVRIQSFYKPGLSNELLLARYIGSFFEHIEGYDVVYQDVERGRVNVLVLPKQEVKYLFLGHLDTVLPPVGEQEVHISEGRFYGLGALDMKAGLAVMLELARGNNLKGVGFIFTVDEEYEFKGIKKLVQEYTFSPKLVINPEPSNLEIIQGCRGVCEMRFSCFGKRAHASIKDQGVNAIERVVKACSEVERMWGLMESTFSNSVNLAYLHGGVQSGGMVVSSGNVVPDYADGVVEVRMDSNVITQEFLENSFRITLERHGLVVSEVNTLFYLGSFWTPGENLGEFTRSVESALTTVTYADINRAAFYEVQFMQEKWGCDCVVFGPGPKEKAHQGGEYVEVGDVGKVYEVYRRFLMNS